VVGCRELRRAFSWYVPYFLHRVVPLSEGDSAALLRSRISGITDSQATQIAERLRGNPRFLGDLVTEAYNNPHWFEGQDPTQPLNAHGLKRMLGATQMDHVLLIHKLFRDSHESVKHWLALASFQGFDFSGELVSALADRLGEAVPADLVDGLRSREGFVKMAPRPSSMGEFRDPAYFESARALLDERYGCPDNPRSIIASTLLDLLLEWRDNGRIEIMPFGERIQALRLHERVFREIHAGLTLSIGDEALLDGIRVELQQLLLQSHLQLPAIEVGRRRIQVIGGHNGPVFCLAWDPKERWLASGASSGVLVRPQDWTHGGEIIVWAAETGRAIRRLETGQRRPIELAVSPDGRHLICIVDRDSAVWVWDTADYRVRYLEGHARTVTRLCVDPEGRWFATGDGSTIRLWDWRSLECVRIIESERAFGEILFIPGRDRIAARLWYDDLGGISVWSLKRLFLKRNSGDSILDSRGCSGEGAQDAASGSEPHQWPAALRGPLPGVPDTFATNGSGGPVLRPNRPRAFSALAGRPRTARPLA